MYYETKEGDDELYRLFQNKQNDDEEKKPRKRRRNEALILEQENDIDRLSNSRPKRAATIRKTEISSGQQRIDDFITKKRSPKKTNPKNLNVNSILPSSSVNQSERCPICDRLISNDILEVHTNACLIQNSDSAKQLIEKSKLRTKIEAVAKEALFKRTTRKKPNINLIRLDSETTTCPTCGMQMTLSRLENQHKKTCSS